MGGGNPTNWWSMMHNPQYESQPLFPSSSSSSNFLADNSSQDQYFPRSWSHLLLGGLSGDQEKANNLSHFQHQQYNKKLENWELLDQTFNSSTRVLPIVEAKQELLLGDFYGYHHQVENEFRSSSSAHQDLPAASSPANSCVTTALNHNNTNILNFSGSKKKVVTKHQRPDNSSEGNSKSSSGGVTKKARVQHSSAQPSLKVRKEKLGDRITALHQLVSPFGKTDTASVLSEAIGYIRFLQAQIQALSSPYMGNNNVAVGSMGHTHQQSSDFEHRVKDLRSRGLCLVPIACTQHVSGNDTVGDYWAPALGGSYL